MNMVAGNGIEKKRGENDYFSQGTMEPPCREKGASDGRDWDRMNREKVPQFVEWPKDGDPKPAVGKHVEETVAANADQRS